jgi:hypothetical protein
MSETKPYTAEEARTVAKQNDRQWDAIGDSLLDSPPDERLAATLTLYADLLDLVGPSMPCGCRAVEMQEFRFRTGKVAVECRHGHFTDTTAKYDAWRAKR